MILTAHTPQYLPGLRLLHKIACADAFVVLDHLPHQHNSFENRNRIRTAQGWQWLTVPVLHGAASLAETKIAPGNWARKHWRAIEMNYRRAAHWGDGFAFEKLVPLADDGLTRLAYATTLYLGSWADIVCPNLVSSSSLRLEGDNWLMILDLCKKMDADTFLFGSNGRNYMSVEAMRAFKKAGVNPLFQSWQIEEYQQCYPGFVSDMSALDTLLNIGGYETLGLIERSGKFKE